MQSPAASTVYLIPSLLHEAALYTIPSYVIEKIKTCQVFFVEEKRSARRYLKSIWKEMQIDQYEWQLINDSTETRDRFIQHLKANKIIGIISEAGCPGVADPGQDLVALAHAARAWVRPLVGPNSILLALMASGMNGQHFQFTGYLPIEQALRVKAIRELESASVKTQSTQIFIETPYRNNQLIDALLKTCQPSTRLCIAVELTSPGEWIRTHSINDWKKNKPDIHKRPAIYLLYAS